MGIFAGPEVIEDGLVLALDAANLKGYDKYENLFTYSGFPQSSNTAFPTGWNGWNPATCLKSQTLSPNEVDYGVFHGAINQNGGGIRKDLTGLSANTTYTISFWGKRITESELTYFTNNNGRGTTTGTTDGAQNVAWFVATKCVVNMANLNGTGASGGQVFTLSETWTKFSTQLTTDSAGSIRIIISNNVSDVGTGNEDGGGTWMIWGAQLEIGSSVTEYYPTTSTAKTRGTTWTDLSIGGGNNGTLVNGPTYDSSNRGSVVFDGTNDYVNLPSSSTLGKSIHYTTSAWIRYKDTGYTGWMMVCDSVNYGVGGGYMMWISIDSPATGKLLASYDGSWQYATTRIPPNTWTNVCISKNNNQVSFYVNGQFDVTRTYNFSGNTSSTDVDIGGSPRNSTYRFNGNIAQVSIYNRALTATEIQKNFNAQRGRFGI